MTRPRPRARQRGFALLIVLFSVALLAFIGTRVTAAGRAETRLATNLRAQAVAEAAADGAVFEALFHALGGGGARWAADGAARRVRLGQAVADVTLVDETRKITLNNAPLPVLQGLLRAIGLDRRAADVLGERIVDWRSPARFPLPLGAKGPQYRAAGLDWGPPNQPFRELDELGLVMGMTPEILARLRPYLSPWVESLPKASDADPVIQAALADAAASGAPPLVFDETPTFTITAVAVSDSGGRFGRRMVVRVNGDAGGDPNQEPFFVLRWDQVPG